MKHTDKPSLSNAASCPTTDPTAAPDQLAPAAVQDSACCGANLHDQILFSTKRLLQSALASLDKGHYFYALIFSELAMTNLVIITAHTITTRVNNDNPGSRCSERCPDCSKLCVGVRDHARSSDIGQHGCSDGHAWLQGATSCLPVVFAHMKISKTT